MIRETSATAVQHNLSELLNKVQFQCFKLGCAKDPTQPTHSVITGINRSIKGSLIIDES